MRAILLITAIATIAAKTYAQDSLRHNYMPVRVDVKIGNSIPPADNWNLGIHSYGFNASIQPNYFFNDWVFAGLHYTYMQLYNAYKQEVSTKKNSMALASFGARGRYKNTSHFWAASIEAGVNFYNNKADTNFSPPPAGNASIYASGKGFVFAPHFGWEYKKFLVDAWYVFAGNKGANTLNLSLGFYLGGGKKHR